MFNLIDVEQGSDEWFKLRLGKLTASQFSKILSPTGKVSTQAADLVNKKIAEKLTGEMEDNYTNPHMERGTELEPEALEFLNFTNGFNFKPVGFADSGMGYGCSPDALDLDSKIGCEIKCPMAKTHVKYLRSGKLPNEYFSQVQGSMLVTGFKQWVFMSYHPTMKPFIITVERDDDYINKLQELLIEKVKEIKTVSEALKNG